MPSVRVERLPVQTFHLGLLGFDHLQLVYRQDEAGDGAGQDGWFVIEGLREPIPGSIRLSVEGWEGRTTLSEANGVSGSELMARIGTPELRGSREIPLSENPADTWATIASFAGDIEAQGFPYIAFSLPGSPIPTINSSSLVSSLLYYVGVDIAAVLPYGMRSSPGMTTLLGSSAADDLVIEGGFTTIVGGEGGDSLRGSDDPGRIDKLYGGKDDDRLAWSEGFNILHGGETGLPYGEDGLDTLSYVGAGVIRIDADPHPVPHYRPDFIVTREGGVDHLYSIERLEWDETTDRIELGEGVRLIQDGALPRLDRSGSGAEHSAARGAVLVNEAAASPTRLSGFDRSGDVWTGAVDDDVFLFKAEARSAREARGQAEDIAVPDDGTFRELFAETGQHRLDTPGPADTGTVDDGASPSIAGLVLALVPIDDFCFL